MIHPDIHLLGLSISMGHQNISNLPFILRFYLGNKVFPNFRIHTLNEVRFLDSKPIGLFNSLIKKLTDFIQYTTESTYLCLVLKNLCIKYFIQKPVTHKYFTSINKQDLKDFLKLILNKTLFF